MVEIRKGETATILPSAVIYAGESHRRRSFLEFVFPEAQIYSFSVEPEPETTDVVAVVEHKIDLGVQHTVELGLNGQSSSAVIVAADIRTLTPYMNNGNNLELRSTSKLKDNDEVWKNLQRMREVSEEMLENPFYIVDIASGTQSLVDNNRRIEKDRVFVFLNAEGLDYLASRGGFDDYLDNFLRFYSEPPYSTHGMPSIGPTDISAGLSVPVLTEMGIIDSIDGVERDNERFHSVFQETLYKVGVGFAPPVLESFHPTIRDSVSGWSWNSQVAEKVLS